MLFSSCYVWCRFLEQLKIQDKATLPTRLTLKHKCQSVHWSNCPSACLISHCEAHTRSLICKCHIGMSWSHWFVTGIVLKSLGISVNVSHAILHGKVLEGWEFVSSANYVIEPSLFPALGSSDIGLLTACVLEQLNAGLFIVTNYTTRSSTLFFGYMHSNLYNINLVSWFLWIGAHFGLDQKQRVFILKLYHFS